MLFTPALVASCRPMLAILGGIGAALAWTATMLAAARATRHVDGRSLLATVMTVGLGWLVFRERLTRVQLGGVVIVALGVALLSALQA